MNEKPRRRLKDLVPPLDLCKQIPEGAFADSTLVWFGHPHTDKTMQVVPRNELGAVCKRFLRMNIRVAYSAPTLGEILEDLAGKGILPECYKMQTGPGSKWYAHCETMNVKDTITDQRPEVAVLTIWLKFYGTEGAK